MDYLVEETLQVSKLQGKIYGLSAFEIKKEGHARTHPYSRSHKNTPLPVGSIIAAYAKNAHPLRTRKTRG